MLLQRRTRGLLIGLALLLGLITWGVSQAWSRRTEPKEEAVQQLAKPDSSLQKLEKASCHGKYRMLLRQFKTVHDVDAPNGFRELGLLKLASYAGQTGLPMGYWVYVEPYWFIWRDLAVLPCRREAWAPHEATGPPDTPASGDFGTAWASLTPGDRAEWLLLEYAKPIVPKAVRIHESWNPGAVIRVSLFRADGKEVIAWEGTDPTPPERKHGVSEISLKADFPTTRVKIYVGVLPDRGWHEIDAVGLVDQTGLVRWASAAEASSTAANASERLLALALIKTNQRIRQLEQEMAELRRLLIEGAGKKNNR